MLVSICTVSYLGMPELTLSFDFFTILSIVTVKTDANITSTVHLALSIGVACLTLTNV